MAKRFYRQWAIQIFKTHGACALVFDPAPQHGVPKELTIPRYQLRLPDLSEVGLQGLA